MAKDRRRRHSDSRHPRVAAYGAVGFPSYGMGYYNGVLGQVVSTNTNPPVSGPPPPGATDQSGHLNPDQFVGYPGGYTTDAGNYTGVEALEGAAGNGGAGGTGGGDAGASGGSPS